MSTLLGQEVLDRRPFAPACEAFSEASFEQVRLADGRVLVVKTFPASDWLMRATRDTDRLGALWNAGVFDRTPLSVDHAMLKTERRAGRRVVVMRDVSAALFDVNVGISHEVSNAVLVAAAALHDAFWGSPVPGLCGLSDYYGLFGFDTASREGDANTHTSQFPRGWHRFAEIVPSDVADPVLRLVECPAALAGELEREEGTLVHGDLKLANLGFAAGRVVMLDWGSLTCWGPAEVDFGWYFGQNAHRVGGAYDDVIADYRRAEGPRVNERALDLALIGALVHFGWRRALWVTENSDPDLRAWAADELGWWVRRVRRAFDTWSPSGPDMARPARRELG